MLIREQAQIVAMTTGRLLGPASCLGRDRCNDTWALAETGKLSPGRCAGAACRCPGAACRCPGAACWCAGRCCRDVAGTLPGRCRDAAAGMLLGRCRDAAGCCRGAFVQPLPSHNALAQHAQDCSESNNSGGTTYWQGHVGSNLSWCILFKESVLLHWSNEILTFSNVSMISECS